MSGFDRLPRGYAEAYPRLDIRDARKFWQRGRRSVSWRLADRTLVGVGHSSMRSTTIFELVAHFRYLDYLPVEPVELSLKFKFHPGSDLNAHITTTCPNCKGSCRILHLIKGYWTCRNCQPLSYRSKMMGDLPRKSEKLAALNGKIGAGRPKGMHNSTYFAMRQARDELALELGNEQIEVSADYAEVISAWWSADPEPLDGAGRYPPFRDDWMRDEEG